MLRALQHPVVAAILLASFASPGFAEETGKAQGRAKGQRAAKAGAAAKAEEAELLARFRSGGQAAASPLAAE